MIRTMRSPGQIRRLSRVAAAAAALLLIGVIVLLVLRKGQYDQLFIQYQVSQAAAALVEQYSEGSASIVLPDEVRAFGIYDAAGRAVFTSGDAPSQLRPDIMNGVAHQSGQRLTQSGTVARLIRVLGTPRGSGGPRGPRQTGGQSSLIALVDYDLTGVSARSRSENFLMALGMLLIVAAIAMVMTLFGRLRRMQHQHETQGRLAQLGQAARTLAHEIRNPLAAAKMQTSLLKRALPDTEHRRLAIIDEELDRIGTLTDQVRTYLQSGTGAPEDVDVVALTREIGNRLPYSVNVDARAEPLVVSVDRERLRSVLVNVIKNAAESTDPSGPVDVLIREHRSRVEVAVGDRGPGVPMADRERIFDPFFTTKAEGSGVGLAIARRYVEEMGGRIDVRDRRGGGAEFVIFLVEVGDARSDR
jgi:signal transduction histidine kinase